jgi:NAD(P)H-hydrate epimerase
MRIVTTAEMRTLEEAADNAGYSYAEMMEAAGRAIAERLKALLPDRQESRVLFLVGKGNNGGDGFVAARILREETLMTIGIITLRPYADGEVQACLAAHVPISLFANDKLNNYNGTVAMVMLADVIVDAVLGTGVKLPLREDVQTLLTQVKRGIAERIKNPQTKDRPQRILAVDLPSGLDADTGEIAPEALTAHETLTFEALKPGHLCFPGAAHVGAVMVTPLDLPPTIPYPPLQQVVTVPVARVLLPARAIDANKGTFGKALVVAGSAQYIGAVALAAESAYRVGAGLVTVATPAPNVSLLAPRLLEATWIELSHEYGAIDEGAADTIWDKLLDYTALLIGPGLDQAQCTRAFIDVLFPPHDDAAPLPTTYPDPLLPTSRLGDALAAGEPPSTSKRNPNAEVTFPPLVIDADGLNLLAAISQWWTRLPPRTVLTPHAGEMARLAKIEAAAGKTGAQLVQGQRYALVRAKAAEWKCIVVLKGANTIIASPDGRMSVIAVATPALARAGTGDVLAGAIVGLLAQGLAPFEAATLAAYLHGTAGLLAAERLGTTASVLASDVLASIPAVLRTLSAPDAVR